MFLSGDERHPVEYAIERTHLTRKAPEGVYVALNLERGQLAVDDRHVDPSGRPGYSQLMKYGGRAVPMVRSDPSLQPRTHIDVSQRRRRDRTDL